MRARTPWPLVVLLALVWAAPAHSASYTDTKIETGKAQLQEQVRKSGTTIRFFRHGHPWMLHVRHRSCNTVVGTRRQPVCRTARAQLRLHTWLRDTAQQRLDRLYPSVPVWRGAASIADPCLRELVGRETGYTYSVHARNPTSGAYGLPQALPGHKMASHGDDWETNPWVQLAWMEDYVNERYGGSCNALAHQRANNWY